MFTVKLHQIHALDVLNRFGISIFRAAIRMILEKDLIKGHRSHIPCIFRANRQTCEQLRAQFFHLRFWKRRPCQTLREEIEQEWQIFCQGTSIEASFMDTGVESQTCTDRLEGVVDFVEGTLFGATRSEEHTS